MGINQQGCSKIKHIAALLLLLSWACNGLAKETTWTELSPGIEYTKIPISTISNRGRIHAFRFSPNQYNLNLAFAKDYGKLALSAYKLGQNTRSLITINGGFFSPNFDPLGLRVQKGRQRSSVKNTSWWGIFYVKNNKAHIINQRRYHQSLNADFAIQAGPRLLVNGHIPKLKDGLAERSGLGITKNGNIIIAITENANITTIQFATLLHTAENQGGLACHNALNLDGGNSSQLYADFPDFSLKINSFNDVTDAITVKAK